MEYLSQILGVLAVVFPASFWVMKAYIVSQVKKAVKEEHANTHAELKEIRESLNNALNTQISLKTDATWIKEALARLEGHFISSAQYKRDP